LFLLRCSWFCNLLVYPR